jgi:uncharacterized protein with PQ loop repeat
MSSIEILGFIAGGLGIYVGVPQALRIRKLGHGEGVSLVAWVLMFSMYCAWAAYGVRISSASTIVCNIVTLLIVGSVVVALYGNLVKSTALLMAIALLVSFFILKIPEILLSITLVISVFSQSPQVIKSFKNQEVLTKSAVSKQALVIGICSVSLWAIYAIIREIWLMLGTSLLAMGMYTLILVFESRNKAKVVN